MLSTRISRLFRRMQQMEIIARCKLSASHGSTGVSRGSSHGPALAVVDIVRKGWPEGSMAHATCGDLGDGGAGGRVHVRLQVSPAPSAATSAALCEKRRETGWHGVETRCSNGMCGCGRCSAGELGGWMLVHYQLTGWRIVDDHCTRVVAVRARREQHAAEARFNTHTKDLSLHERLAQKCGSSECADARCASSVN